YLLSHPQRRTRLVCRFGFIWPRDQASFRSGRRVPSQPALPGSWRLARLAGVTLGGGQMLKKIGIGLGLLVIAFLIVVALQPAEFRIERSQRMDAPPYVVFNLLNNFHRWPAWSPWEKLDPNMQKKHAGPEF